MLALAACGGKKNDQPFDPCFLGECDAGAGGVCETADDCADPAQPCVVWECDDGACRATGDVLDADGDGHPSFACGGDDCDDADPAVPAEGGETCNGVDDDCDGVVDEGTLSAGDDVTVSADLASTVALAQVTDGAGWGILWAQDGTRNLEFQLLDGDGGLLGAAQPLPGTWDASEEGGVALVSMPGGFVAAWGQSGAIDWVPIPIESGPGDVGEIPTADESATFVQGAYSGSTIALGWIGHRSAFLYPTWAILDPVGPLVLDPTEAQNNTTPNTIGISWLGDRFGVLFEGVWAATGDGGKLLFLDEDGAQTGPAEYTDGDATFPVAVRDGEVLHVLWSERDTIGLRYRATNPDGGPLTNAVLLELGAYAPAVASAGHGTLAAWLVGFDLANAYHGDLEAAPIGQSLAEVPEGESPTLDLVHPVDGGVATGRPALVADADGGFSIAFAAQSGGVFFDRITCR
jgi:putative metal-binding protein